MFLQLLRLSKNGLTLKLTKKGIAELQGYKSKRVVVVSLAGQEEENQTEMRKLIEGEEYQVGPDCASRAHSHGYGRKQSSLPSQGCGC